MPFPLLLSLSVSLCLVPPLSLPVCFCFCVCVSVVAAPQGVDMWALGCLTYIVLFGGFPFYNDEDDRGRTVKSLKDKIREGKYLFPTGNDPGANGACGMTTYCASLSLSLCVCVCACTSMGMFVCVCKDARAFFFCGETTVCGPLLRTRVPSDAAPLRLCACACVPVPACLCLCACACVPVVGHGWAPTQHSE
jgi:serine/threonine protein kinase